jgi:hypothetical protein
MLCLSCPALLHRLWLVVCWVDILLDVITGVESVLLEGCLRTRSRPGADVRGQGVGQELIRTILLFHDISARPSKHPRMVGSTLGVYSFGLIFVSARTNKRDGECC